jgi:hypothetical protein
MKTRTIRADSVRIRERIVHNDEAGKVVHIRYSEPYIYFVIEYEDGWPSSLRCEQDDHVVLIVEAE